MCGATSPSLPQIWIIYVYFYRQQKHCAHSKVLTQIDYSIVEMFRCSSPTAHIKAPRRNVLTIPQLISCLGLKLPGFFFSSPLELCRNLNIQWNMVMDTPQHNTSNQLWKISWMFWWSNMMVFQIYWWIVQKCQGIKSCDSLHLNEAGEGITLSIMKHNKHIWKETNVK